MAGWEKVGSGGRGGTRPDVFGVGEKRGRGAARQKKCTERSDRCISAKSEYALSL